MAHVVSKARGPLKRKLKSQTSLLKDPPQKDLLSSTAKFDFSLISPPALLDGEARCFRARIRKIFLHKCKNTKVHHSIAAASCKTFPAKS